MSAISDAEEEMAVPLRRRRRPGAGTPHAQASRHARAARRGRLGRGPPAAQSESWRMAAGGGGGGPVSADGRSRGRGSVGDDDGVRELEGGAQLDSGRGRRLRGSRPDGERARAGGLRVDGARAPAGPGCTTAQAAPGPFRSRPAGSAAQALHMALQSETPPMRHLPTRTRTRARARAHTNTNTAAHTHTHTHDPTPIPAH